MAVQASSPSTLTVVSVAACVVRLVSCHGRCCCSAELLWRRCQKAEFSVFDGPSARNELRMEQEHLPIAGSA